MLSKRNADEIDGRKDGQTQHTQHTQHTDEDTDNAHTHTHTHAHTSTHTHTHTHTDQGRICKYSGRSESTMATSCTTPISTIRYTALNHSSNVSYPSARSTRCLTHVLKAPACTCEEPMVMVMNRCSCIFPVSSKLACISRDSQEGLCDISAMCGSSQHRPTTFTRLAHARRGAT